MATNTKIVTSLDPSEIKQSLKDYLSGQSEFTSYDFEGSGLSVILDILAQNTYYISFLANMLANEMTLDTSQVRSIIASHAQKLSYTPHSRVASVATVDIVVTPPNPGSAPATLTLDKETRFVSSVNDQLFYFLNTDIYTTSLVDDVYTFTGVELYQGRFLEIDYTVSDSREKFQIPNKEVDTNQMIVTVQNSISDNVTNTFTKSDNILNIDSESNVYFVSENSDKLFEIEFGDGVLGASTVPGNIVNIKYLATKGEDANGASSFDAVSDIGTFNNINITTIQKSYGGKAIESDDSIKFNAPKKFFTQNRAVIADDYIPLMKSIVPQAVDVKAWGGEDNDPPSYGIVYIAVKMPGDTKLTQATKDSIVLNNLKPYAITTITPIIVDADDIDIEVSLTVNYNKTTLSIKESELISDIKDEILAYSSDELGVFGSRFRMSSLSSRIDDMNSSIKSNFITSLTMYKTFSVVNGINQSLNIQFGDNAIKEGSILINGFSVTDATTSQLFGKVYYISDDDGVLKVYRNNQGTEVVVIDNIGSVDYESGKIILNNFKPLDSDNILTIKTSPLYFDVKAVRGEILQISSVDDILVTVIGE